MSIDHYENFPVASVLLPARLRKPVEVIYQFARTADDFADEGTLQPDERLRLLANYGDELRCIERGEMPRTALFRELAAIIKEFCLPLPLFHDLLSAFTQDVTKTRYTDFAEVLDYCRRSANPVGRLMLILYGASNAIHERWSDNICSSLQIINFLQDIAIDYSKGRVYLCQDEMVRYGISESAIAGANVSDDWRSFMAFQVERTQRMLHDGAQLGNALSGRIGLEMRTIIAGGDRILSKIIASDYDVYRHRPVLRWHDWAGMLLRSCLPMKNS